jgi:o-succinylbenzoate synthase
VELLTELRLRVPLRAPYLGAMAREVTLLHGPAGWGECSPLPGYPCDPDAARRSAEEAATVPWPAPVREEVAVNALVPALPPEEAAGAAAEAVAAGMGTVKVKVGTGAAADLDRVAAVRSAVGDGVRIRLDANGAWDLDEAAALVPRLARYGIELVEQPVAGLDDLARLRRRVDVPLAADESLRSLEDAHRLARLGAADVAVVKVQPLGGVRAALAVAEAAGVPVIVTSMLETSVGLAAGLALAACLPELPFACGLGTAALLAGDVVADPLLPEAGALRVRRPEPDPRLLDTYARKAT